MPMDATIRTKVQECTKEEKMFTSVDIANAVKRDGVWVRTREVRDWLRANFSDVSIFSGYAQSTIDVCNGNAQATLYHPAFKDQSEYTDRDQVSLTPDEVAKIQKSVVGTPNAATAPDISAVLDDKTDPDMSIVIKSKDRIKIPGEMIRKLGWMPGDSIDPACIKTHQVIPSRLKVNSDYRVSIPRSAVSWGTDPVKVMLKGQEIVFDKA